MEKDFDYYKDLIEKKQLPEGFDQWLMTDDEGNTLAHCAANYGNLPLDWTDKTEDWLVKDNDGATIAHKAAQSEILPPDWTNKIEDWLIKDKWGNAVAHWAAHKGIFPLKKNTMYWLEKDNSSVTLAYYAAEKGLLPNDWTNNLKDWLIMNKNSLTIGFMYSSYNKQHYNDPQTLEDYCQNMKDHFFPVIDKKGVILGLELEYFYNIDRKGEILRLELQCINNFIEPFVNQINNTTSDNWMKTSDAYSGFLIDYTESVVSHIQDHLRFDDDIQGDNLILANQIKEKIDQTSQYIQEEKVKVKENLFKKNESKNTSIIKENEPDLMSTL